MAGKGLNRFYAWPDVLGHLKRKGVLYRFFINNIKNFVIIFNVVNKKGIEGKYRWKI